MTFPHWILSAGLVAFPGWAAAQLDLARSNGCVVCHSIDKKVIGPAWRDVAVRYAGRTDATEELMRNILRGGVGSWGVAPMPPNPDVSEADARRLALWVLALPNP